MLDQSNPFTALKIISWIVWKIPARRSFKMAGFSHTESGSSLDMMEAAEETDSPDLKKKFFRHALDEFRHARLFAERSLALARTTQVADILVDPEYSALHGLRNERSLYRQLGETNFLAFVWMHESQGAKQFAIYSELMKHDPISSAMFAEICRDEEFHVAYSRQELDRIATLKGSSEVNTAIRRLRLRRMRDSYLRMARSFGDLVASLWLFLIFTVIMAPFALIQKRASSRSDFVSTPDAMTRARAEIGFQG